MLDLDNQRRRSGEPIEKGQKVSQRVSTYRCLLDVLYSNAAKKPIDDHREVEELIEHPKFLAAYNPLHHVRHEVKLPGGKEVKAQSLKLKASIPFTAFFLNYYENPELVCRLYRAFLSGEWSSVQAIVTKGNIGIARDRVLHKYNVSSAKVRPTILMDLSYLIHREIEAVDRGIRDGTVKLKDEEIEAGGREVIGPLFEHIREAFPEPLIPPNAPLLSTV